MKKGIHIMNQKKSKAKYMSPYYFYSIFNMSSCRKPEIQNDFPKITKIECIANFFNKLVKNP